MAVQDTPKPRRDISSSGPLAKQLLADPQRRAECEALAAQLHKPLMAVAISISMKSGHCCPTEDHWQALVHILVVD